MEAARRPKSSQHRAQEPSKTLLAPGCRPKPFSAASWSVFGSPRNPKNHAPASMRAQCCLKSLIAPGAPKSSPKGSQNRGQKPPWRLQDGFKTRPQKASMLDPMLKLCLSILEAPGRGGEHQNGFHNRFKNGLGFKALSFHPRKRSRSPF